MCRLTTCSKCHRPTYAGCGAHIEQVLGHVPKDQRCTCRETTATAAAPKSGGFLQSWKNFFGS